ncbi:gluzincin family metallopeptidase [Polaribacter sp. M15]
MFCCAFLAQENTISIEANLNVGKDEMMIKQEIVFFNTTGSTLHNIYLHNWPNSFRDRKTPLSQRFIKDYRKDLYFAKQSELGKTTIKNLTVDFENTLFNEHEGKADILNITLNKPLQPKEKTKIIITYTVKIPSASFTGYGKTKEGYHLRFWYITPAVYDKGWALMSNLNIDDLYEKPTDFKIDINIPKSYVLESNLYQYITKKEDVNNYYLIGKKKSDVILSIHKTEQFKTYKTKKINVYTDVLGDEYEIDYKSKIVILNRNIQFLEKYLGQYPHKELFIDKATQKKDPVIGLTQLPDFLRPFSETFKADITIFKALSRKYIENTLFLNKRKDYWLLDGLQNYFMIEYIEEFYPETKLLGKFSDTFFLRSFNISKADFNDKYPLIYQFVSRKFLDQALTTSADSLSNFNRKIANKYKAGMAFRYLKGYLGDSILNNTIKDFYQNNQTKIVDSKDFQKLLASKTRKETGWFFDDFIKTNKKIDHTIDDIEIKGDSVHVKIRNKRNMTTPVLVYGLKDKEIKYKKWVTGVKDTANISIPKNGINKVSLNYENFYPELNTLDNWKRLQNKIFNKPLKFSLIKDIQDPYYNQLFYQPNFSYNFYNGLTLGVSLHNKPLIKRNLEVSIAPAYATKSGSVIGNFSVKYHQYFEETSIYKIVYGMDGGTSDYAPELSYTAFVPYVNLFFKRKDLRDATQEAITARMLYIDRERPLGEPIGPEDQYTIFNLRYNYMNPDIIKEFRYNFSLEIAENFSKVSADIRYRALSTSDTQLDFRLFAGSFLNNSSTGNYFSFGLDRANDYLFQLNYFGRSEDSGIFSQQFIIAEGGFKSVLPTRFANQYMVSLNSSFGLWRWVEFYNDVAFLKNKNIPIYFAYNNGIRLNFVHNIFEIYFPLYSNNGWEIGQQAYAEKIRFTFTGNLRSIFNFVRRGFL